MPTIKYPITAANGDLVVSDNPNVEAILSALATMQGERILRNSYGQDLDAFYTAADLDDRLLRLLADLNYSVADYPVLIADIHGTVNDDGTIDISIYYNDGETDQTISTRIA